MGEISVETHADRSPEDTPVRRPQEGVPETSSSVSATRDEATTVRAETDGKDIVGMAAQRRCQRLTTSHAPEANAVVGAARCEHLAPRRECDAQDGIGMAIKGL